MRADSSGVSQSQRPLRRPSLWKVPLILFLIGSAVTAVFAVQQERAVTQRAEDRFEAQVGSLERSFSAAISKRINEFNVGLDFVSSSPTIDSDQFQAFLTQRSENRSAPVEGDPGFAISEFVSDLDALEAREQANGREDFTVFAPLPANAPSRVVITHLERDIPVMGRSFVGFDVTGFQGMLSPDGRCKSFSAASKPLAASGSNRPTPNQRRHIRSRIAR